MQVLPREQLDRRPEQINIMRGQVLFEIQRPHRQNQLIQVRNPACIGVRLRKVQELDSRRSQQLPHELWRCRISHEKNGIDLTGAFGLVLNTTDNPVDISVPANGGGFTTLANVGPHSVRVHVDGSVNFVLGGTLKPTVALVDGDAIAFVGTAGTGSVDANCTAVS